MTELQFPFTKFVPPVLDERVYVEDVVARLDAAVAAHPLTLVSAPAGSGKSTALAGWARQAEGPVVWVRMNADEDDPSAAAAALLVGMQRAVPGFGERLEQVLRNRDAAASVPHLVTALVNDLGDGSAVRLVLDDFHEITDPACLDFFDRLLDHLPSGVRVLIGTRTEPALSLPRRRVRGELAELGLADLRLSSMAIRRLLGTGVGVDDGFVADVEFATGGWAAAVRLTAAQLATRPAGRPAVNEDGMTAPARDGLTATGGDGHTAPVRDAGAAVDSSGPKAPSGDVLRSARPDLWRFLANGVLDAQPEEIRTFLLETSVLEELSAPVCQAVTGRADSAQLLEELDRRNLFVTRHPGAEGDNWRYHDLFRAFLGDRLRGRYAPGTVQTLHRRAASVLHGVPAVAHNYAAGDYDAAAELIIEIGFVSSYITTLPALIPWINRLPAEVHRRHPRLQILLASRDELRGRMAEVLARMEPLRARSHAAGDPVTAAEASAMLASSYIAIGDFERAGQALKEALDQPLPLWLRTGLLIVNTWWCFQQGKWSEASRVLAEAFDRALTADDAGVPRLIATGLSSPLLFVDHGPDWVLDRARRLAARLDVRDTMSHAALRSLQAGGALLRLDLDSAARDAQRSAAEIRELGGLAWFEQDTDRLLLILALARGDHATVRSIVDEAAAQMATSPIHLLERWGYAYAAIRSDWLRGEPHRIAETCTRLLGGEASSGQEMLVRSLAGALVARTDGRFEEAEAILRDAEAFQHAGPYWLCAGLPGLERAAILFERGHLQDAIDAAEPTLAVASRLGAGILLSEAPAHRALLKACAREYAHADVVGAVLWVLDDAARPVARPVPETGETLSAREVEVLREVALGGSNREIADALFISEVTVKSHLTRILRKLQARSRTQAVARARELRLL